MIIRFSFILLPICFIFAEAKPLMSISQDLSIIFHCNATSPVDKRTLNMALVEKHFGENVDESFKCFLHCLYHEYDWMDGDGDFHFDVMRSTLFETNLDESAIEYLLTTCSETEVEDKCERAYSFTECFWTESDKLEETFSVEEKEEDELC